jgi:hypothetical protein
VNPGDDPLSFACPRCGRNMAVTRVDGKIDIFHLKPTCAAFDAHEIDYRDEVLGLDEAQRVTGRGQKGNFYDHRMD